MSHRFLFGHGSMGPPRTEARPTCASKAHSLKQKSVVQAVLELVKLKPTVIRGNASEIMAVAGAAGVTTRGVDSTAEAEEALELGKRLAADAGCVVAISGATDLASC